MKKLLLFVCVVIAAYAKKPNLVVLDTGPIEIIYMLGGEESIKAIAKLQYSHIYPHEKTSKLDSVGSFSNPSLEKIVALKPDLVILSNYSAKLRDRLHNLNIKTMLLQGNSFEDIRNNIRTIGKIIGKEDRAEELIREFNDDINKLKEEPLNQSVIFLYSSQPLMAFDNNYLVDDALSALGLRNLSPSNTLPKSTMNDLKRRMSQPIITTEYLMSKNPDIIIYGMRVKDVDTLIKNNPALEHTNAFKNNRIYTFDGHLILRPSPTIIHNIKKLRDIIRGESTPPSQRI